VKDETFVLILPKKEKEKRTLLLWRSERKRGERGGRERWFKSKKKRSLRLGSSEGRKKTTEDD